jgi:hypothetical protein
MQVRIWCVAATEIVQGSAGRIPTLVVNTKDRKSQVPEKRLIFRSCFEICKTDIDSVILHDSRVLSRKRVDSNLSIKLRGNHKYLLRESLQ